MKRFKLGETSPTQYEGMTEEEKQAWLHPAAGSYHSFHIERLGADLFRFRDSREGTFYQGTAFEVYSALTGQLRCRTLDPDYQNQTTVLRVLSQEEVDDLLSDL